MNIRALAAAVLVSGLMCGPGLIFAPGAEAAAYVDPEDRDREAAERAVARFMGGDRDDRRDRRADRRGDRRDDRADRRDHRRDHRADRRDHRRDHDARHRDHRRDARHDRRHDRREYRRDRRDDRWDRRYDRRHRHYDRYDRRHHRYGSHRNWRYHDRYYNHYARHDFRYDNRFCRTDGDAVIAGALIGAILGGVAGDGDGGAALAGGLLGAGLGASVNDCDRGQYRYAVHNAFTNDRPYYWHNPYSGVRGVVYARDYHNWNRRQCRWGDAEIFLPNGRVVYDRVRMCRDRYGRWEVARRQ
ncbi:MAG: hypothetical protein ABL308_08655 [Oceanicaulis sp.]